MRALEAAAPITGKSVGLMVLVLLLLHVRVIAIVLLLLTVMVVGLLHEVVVTRIVIGKVLSRTMLRLLGRCILRLLLTVKLIHSWRTCTWRE